MTERKFRERKIESILTEDGTVKFNFVTSLEKIAVAKIVSNLWMRQNIHREIVILFHSGISPKQSKFKEKWQQIVDNILAAVYELCLPRSIAKMLAYTVPVLGNFVLDWIQYHDKCILNTKENSIHSAANLINHITWTDRGRIDLAVTAKNILDNGENSLSDDQKYKIACTYCLEDEIFVLAPKVVNQHYLDSVDIAIHPIVSFWTTCITGDNNKLHNHSGKNISIKEHAIQLLINCSNEIRKTGIFNAVPIIYMWNKLSEQEKAKNLTLLIKFGNEDLRYSLLSNLDYEQQQDIFKECSGPILVGILKDWLLEEYFLPIALHVLEIMAPRCYMSIVWAIIKEIEENRHAENNHTYNQHKFCFKVLWQNASSHLKDYTFEHLSGYSLDRLTMEFLSWEQDLDIIDLIFKDLNAHQKYNIIYGKQGLKRCSQLFRDDEWDLLELFIRYTLSSEEDISRIKGTLMRCEGIDKAYSYLENEALDKIERLMIWAFKSIKEMDRFRQRLAYIVVWPATKESIIANHKVDFTKLEDHFKWCAKGDPGLINQFKIEIIYWHHSGELIEKLMEKSQYELVDQILNWCYSDNQQHTAEFKYEFYKTNFDFVKLLIEKDTSLKMLDKFIGWSFTNEHQIQEFKTWVLSVEEKIRSNYFIEKYWGICTDFLLQERFELADKILKWCLISDENISKFKKELMFSDDVNIMFSFRFLGKKPDLPLLIQWFNPSEELVKAFKKKFPEEECPNNFHKLLDAFLQKHNNLLENN